MSTTTPTKKGSAEKGSLQRKRRQSPQISRIRRKTSISSAEPMPWEEWTEHLEDRDEPTPLADLVEAGKISPLSWGWQGDDAALELVQQLHALHSGKTPAGKRIVELLERRLDEDRPCLENPDDALECLAWCHALPRLAESLPSAPWWQLYDYLAVTARDAAGIKGSEQPLVRQLLAGELPLTLGYLFPEVKRASRLITTGAKVVSSGLVETLDGEGMPHCRDLPKLRALLACWTRSGFLLDETDYSLSEDAEDEYRWLIQQTLRLSRADSTPIFSTAAASKADRALLRAALLQGGNDEDREIAAATLTGMRSEKPERAPRNLPEPAFHSEWSELALLRTDWKRNAANLSLCYGDGRITTELTARGATYWSGEMDFEITIDGKRLDVEADDWEEVCWHSDDDVDYIELELELDDDLRVQRQYLLAREDGFLFTADALLGVTERQIDYRRGWSLCPGIKCRTAEETQECFLETGRESATVLPLALSEWRGDRGGALNETDGKLQLTLSSQGHCLYAPMFFDLKPRRGGNRLTWRRLTVAEALEIQPPDVAVGYRVQIGGAQWLIYRSLGEQGNRSLLGQNFSSEFFLGRFTRDGETEELLEIGGPED